MHYRDISLVPNYSELESRSFADARMAMPVHGSDIDRHFESPLIPANMKCTIGDVLAYDLSESGYFYVMHRFDHDQLEWVKSNQNFDLISMSLGVKASDYELINNIRKDNLRVDYITIDVAHGHHILMKNILAHVRNQLPDVTIIAGNVATVSGTIDLKAWGADVVKVGIGGGSACITKDQTGFTTPMYSTIQKIFDITHGVIPLIACGGAESNGDLAKAIHAGANGIMVGGMLAACIDAPGKTFRDGNTTYKEYYGSASAESKGENKHVEGAVRNLICNNTTYLETLHDTKEALQSAISYAGGKSLYDIRKAEYVRLNYY